MSLWVMLGGVSQALLSLVEIVLYTFIAYHQGVSGAYLALLAAAWSFVFFVASRLMAPSAEAGCNKGLGLVALVSMIASVASFAVLRGVVGAAAAFLFHAVASASLSVSLGLTSMEYTEYRYWVRIDIVERILSLLFIGVVLVALGRRIVTWSPLEMMLAGLGAVAAYYVAIPPVVLDFERRYYRFNRYVESIRGYVRAMSVLSYIGSPRAMEIAYSRIKARMPSYLSPERVALGALLATAVGEYIMAVLPVNMRDVVTLTTLWQGYGYAAIITAAALLPIALTQRTNPVLAGSLSLLRGIVLVAFFPVLRTIRDIALYVAASSIIFGVIDAILANYFVDAAYARRGTFYQAMREIGSILGPLLAAVLYGTGLFGPVAVLLAILSFIVLL